MGVPAFFRWLTRKYPSVVVHCIEQKPQDINGTKVPIDSSQPNPNGVEFDNLYLDMNGIIHPCTHPEDKPAPKNEEEMMIAIFECIDRLFRIVRPRKILYMAIDGVAPRAKMNQQRSRRFRASKESYEKLTELDRVRADLEAKGCVLPPPKPKGSHFDSNCITPGTPFMDRLSSCLHFYIHDRLNNDPGWIGIKVILSDANVPGEGEHKIMDFIRRQRAMPDHDPNTAHCLCGADADLIMLGLATHEPNFTIIREEFKPNQPRPCEMCGQMGHEMKDCLGLEKECPEDDEPPAFAAEVEFIFVRINVLREYLERELQMPNLPFPYEFERTIDDWVFMCFFVGNDFLPHLPSLEIRENAIDKLVEFYKQAVYKTGGYITDSGFVNLERVQLILADLGKVEDSIFKSRQENDKRFKARIKAQKKRRRMTDANCYNRPSFLPKGQFAPIAIGNTPSPIQNAKTEAMSMRIEGMHTDAGGSNKEAAAKLKSLLKIGEPSTPTTPQSQDSSFSDGSPSPMAIDSKKRKADSEILNLDSDSEEEPNDEVRLWEQGFKDRYYESKFDVTPENIEFRTEVARQYVYGLCWVLRYYYQGCASWKWYFPYHYAPFASDFINIGDLSTEFEKNTKPFEPLEQLMGVFPAGSKSHVPAPWATLMEDPESPIIDFYPEDFQIDLNGKKYAWQGVALLPFVDEKRLKDTLVPYYSKLTDEEVRRNKRGDDRLYVAKTHSGYEFLNGLLENGFDSEEGLLPKDFQGMTGTVLISQDYVPAHGILESPIRGLEAVIENKVLCTRYRDPKYKDDFVFPAKRLKNSKSPPQVLKPEVLDKEQSRNWRAQVGMAPATQRASLNSSAHRMLAYEGVTKNPGSYANMPPPPSNYLDRLSQGQNRYQQGGESRSYSHQQQRTSYGGGSNNRGGRGGGSYQERQSYQQNYYQNSYQQQYQPRGGHSGGSSHQSYSSSSYGYSTTNSSSGNQGGSISRNNSSQGYNNNGGRRDNNNRGGRGGRQDGGYQASGYNNSGSWR